MKKRRSLVTVLALGLFFCFGLPLSQGAPVSDQIPVQGRLTDAGGIPLNGAYTINFWVYDVADGGGPICGNIVTPNVAVINGLFNVTLDLCQGATNGKQLYLGVKVGDDPEMTPRLPIITVPYAQNLRPGATIQGANSFVFAPGTAFARNSDDTAVTWGLSGASAVIRRGDALVGTKHIRIPITIPTVLYGKPVRVTNVTVYYRCQDGAANFITETELYKQTDADTFVALVNDTTHRTSNVAANYSLATDPANYTFTSGQGLALRLGLFFSDSVNYIQIGGVRVTLDTTY